VVVTTKKGTISASAVNILVHPLVLMNISDHATRTQYQRPTASSSNPQDQIDQRKVVGALLGAQKGRELEINSSFEMVLRRDSAGKLEINTDLLTRKADASK
jgi:COP9 signalosome complex subunit 6